MAKAKERK